MSGRVLYRLAEQGEVIGGGGKVLTLLDLSHVYMEISLPARDSAKSAITTMLPVSTLEGWAKVIGSMWPTTYYMHLSVGAFTKGLGAGDLLPDIVALFLFMPVFTVLAAFFLKKQEG